MPFYSANDLDLLNPYNLDTNTLELPWFLKFYCWWNNQPIPKLSTLADNASSVRSTETMAKLLLNARKEVKNLSLAQSFLPDWFIFRSFNEWIKDTLIEHLAVLSRTIKLAINETLSRNAKVHIRCLKLRKSDLDLSTLVLSPCLLKHQQEIAEHYVKPEETYVDLKSKIKDSQSSIKHFLNHRQHVIKTETPYGKLRAYSIGTETFYSNEPPTEKELEPLQDHLGRIDKDIRQEEAYKSKLTKQLYTQFFLPKEYNNPDKYQELLQNRTDEAIHKLY
ncbi:MAG: hypothetical protein H0T84_06550 [Tatlockia sp.]|nr:hypothetical protein [Tatlockia sp.]